jgi:hypothetical protein
MVSAEYATRRPPPPSSAASFVHHQLLPAAINASASFERGLSIASDAVRARPVVAVLLITLLGYRLGRRRARRFRRGLI